MDTTDRRERVDREMVQGHLEGKGKVRVVAGETQSKEGFLYLCLDGTWEGSVWVRKTDVE